MFYASYLDLGDVQFGTLVTLSEQFFEESLGKLWDNRVIAAPGYSLDCRQHRVVQLLHRGRLFE